MEKESIHPLLVPESAWIDPGIQAMDGTDRLHFSLRDAFMYHGFDAPGGVVLGWRLLQRAFSMLSPGAAPERHGFSIFTSFPGLGFRDTVEYVLRAVEGQRLTVDPEYEHPDAPEGVAGRFYYRFEYGGRAVELAPIEGYPGEDFVKLGRASKRAEVPPGIAGQWKAAKFSLANTLLEAPAGAVIRVL